MVYKMELEFDTVLAEHRKRYPLMQPQDYGKLAFQSEFGPEHLVDDSEKALSWILEEALQAEKDSVKEAEWIGNGLCRFPLAALENPAQEAPVLTALFMRTAREHQGTMEGLQERLDRLKALEIPGMEVWLREYRGMGCPAVHHSDLFRDTYHPHYRLLKMEYALYFPVIAAVSQRLQSQAAVCIAIDGRCGSGKTTLSAMLQKLFGCNVFHMDDFYRPFAQRPSNWTEIPAGNMDLERFLHEVLVPVREGKPVLYRRYDCQNAVLQDAEYFAPTSLTVIDGSYSHHPMLADQYDLKVFLTCSKEEQERRLRRREGENFAGFERFWIPMEERYHCAFSIQEKSSIVIDTDGLLGSSSSR